MFKIIVFTVYEQVWITGNKSGIVCLLVPLDEPSCGGLWKELSTWAKLDYLGIFSHRAETKLDD